MSRVRTPSTIQGEKRKRDDDDPPNSFFQPRRTFSAESDQHLWVKVQFGNPKQTHLSRVRFECYCELDEETEKDDMVVVQGTPGLLVLEGTEVVWNADAKCATDKLDSSPIQAPLIIKFDVDEQTQIWQRVYKDHTMLRISVGNEYRTMIFPANKQGSAALGRLCSIIEHKQLKSEATKNVFEAEGAIEAQTQKIEQGVKLSGEAGVNTSSGKTAKAATDPTDEHCEAFTSAGKAIWPCGCDDHGTDFPSEYLYERGEEDHERSLDTYNQMD